MYINVAITLLYAYIYSLPLSTLYIIPYDTSYTIYSNLTS